MVGKRWLFLGTERKVLSLWCFDTNTSIQVAYGQMDLEDGFPNPRSLSDFRYWEWCGILLQMPGFAPPVRAPSLG